jgi:hypothetical protein
VQALQARADGPPPEARPGPFGIAPAVPAKVPLGYELYWPWVLAQEGVSMRGYLQSQYEWHQNSQDQLYPGGALMNQNRFDIARSRVSLVGDWEYTAFAVEIDANTRSGAQVDLRKAEASLQYRPDRSKPPIIMATLGQFDTPYGYELVESPSTRWFMERSTLSRAFWPGEPDLGVRLAGALGFFRWTIAAVNGHPLGEGSPYALQDPIDAKDIVFRFGFDTRPREDFHIAGDVSASRGRGFHAGTDATKGTLRWVDLNEDGIAQQIEIRGVPPEAATRSQTFERWAVGAEVRAHVRWPVGVMKIYGGITMGANMDRGMFIADPILNNFIDQRELGYYVGATQEIFGYGIVGFRYDVYDPNLDASDSRAGSLLPYSQAIKTSSPLVGVFIPNRARLLFQYDAINNALARSMLGVPTKLKEDAWTLRLQVNL